MMLLTVILLGIGVVCNGEAVHSVKITTIPRQGPFISGQLVQFSCEVEPTPSLPLTYQWQSIYDTMDVQQFNMTFYNTRDSHYQWYFCSVSTNGRVLGSTNRIVELYGLLYTEESIAQSFSLRDRIVLRVNISDDFNSRYIQSLAWYHNGTEMSSGSRVSLSNNATALTISDMDHSDAGRYEVRIRSTNCESLNENMASGAPVTFLLQESSIPSYDPNDIVSDYIITASQDGPQQNVILQGPCDERTYRIPNYVYSIYDNAVLHGQEFIKRWHMIYYNGNGTNDAFSAVHFNDTNGLYAVHNHAHATCQNTDCNAFENLRYWKIRTNGPGTSVMTKLIVSTAALSIITGLLTGVIVIAVAIQLCKKKRVHQKNGNTQGDELEENDEEEYNNIEMDVNMAYTTRKADKQPKSNDPVYALPEY